MREEDEEQHAQALRSRGHGEPEAQAPAAEAAPAEAAAEAPDAVARPAPDATSARTKAAEDDEPAAPEARPAPEPADTEEAERYATMPVDPRARQVWRSALERIRPNISQSAFMTWLSGTSGLVFEPDALIVRVGSSFSRDHLENRFQDLIASALSEQLRATTEAHFVVIPEFEEDRA